MFYLADDLNNAAGNNFAPNDFQAFVYAQVPRAIWITDMKILGGYFGGDVVVPIVYISLKNLPLPTGPYTSSAFGLGDFTLENTLSWHPGQFDIGSAVGINMPTGASGKPTSARTGLLGAATDAGSNLVCRRGQDLGDFGAEPV